MALIQLGALVTDIRGHTHGTVFSRSGAGNYMRSQPHPINPRSASQSARRQALARWATAWSAELDDDQRAAWEAYVAATSWTNRLGQSIQISGVAALARLNTLLQLAEQDPQLDGPAINGHPGTPAVTITAEPTAGTLTVAEITEPFDPEVDGELLLLFAALPAPAGRLAIPRGMTYVDVIAGDSSTAPTFPAALNSPYPFQAGQRVTTRCVYIDHYGRVATPSIQQAIAADPT